VTIEVNDESLNNLLSSKPNTQLLRADFLPEKFLSGRHITPQFFPGTARQGRCCALKFFFGDALTWDDVFDGHGVFILPCGLER